MVKCEFIIYASSVFLTGCPRIEGDEDDNSDADDVVYDFHKKNLQDGSDNGHRITTNSVINFKFYNEFKELLALPYCYHVFYYYHKNN